MNQIGVADQRLTCRESRTTRGLYEVVALVGLGYFKRLPELYLVEGLR